MKLFLELSISLLFYLFSLNVNYILLTNRYTDLLPPPIDYASDFLSWWSSLELPHPIHSCSPVWFRIITTAASGRIRHDQNIHVALDPYHAALVIAWLITAKVKLWES